MNEKEQDLANATGATKVTMTTVAFDESVINNDVIDSLSEDVLDDLLAMFKKAGY